MVAKGQTDHQFSGQYVYAVGRRKTSVATVRVYPEGKGVMYVNGMLVKEYVKDKYDLDTILSPLTLTDMKGKVDCSVQVEGGGMKAQAEAIRLGISKGLCEIDMMMRPSLKKEGFLTRDSRMKERKKPGLKRARRSPQWAKR